MLRCDISMWRVCTVHPWIFFCMFVLYCIIFIVVYLSYYRYILISFFFFFCMCHFKELSQTRSASFIHHLVMTKWKQKKDFTHYKSSQSVGLRRCRAVWASQLWKAKTPKYGEIPTHMMSIRCGIQTRFIRTPGQPDQEQCFAVCVS